MPRTRTNGVSYSSTGKVTGKRWAKPGISDSFSYTQPLSFSHMKSQNTCTDELHPYPYKADGPLDIIKRNVVPLVFNGKSHPVGGNNIGYGPWTFTFQGYVIENSGWLGQNSPLLGQPDFLYWKNRAIANMNPNKPTVDVPLFLFELKDMPRMLKGLGDVLSGKRKPSQVPGGYLAYHFGWGPLFRDLLAFRTLMDAVRQRSKELSEMARVGLRLHRSLGGYDLPTYDQGPIWTVTLDGSNIASFRVRWKGREKAWYTARLHLYPNNLPSDLDAAAFDAVLGIQGLSAATIWNMLPWSWLIDYFVSVGTYLEASRGGIHWYASKFNVMSHRRWDRSVVPINVKAPYSGGTGIMEYKSRRQYIAKPSLPTMSIFTGQHAGILGSLITAKALKSVKR